MNPYTEALLPTPNAIVNNRASDRTGARAKALVELRMLKKTLANFIPDSLQLKARNKGAFFLHLLELGERVRPVSCSLCPY
jgi:hypothetical protein